MTMRLFYAVPVPAEIRRELRQAAESMGRDWRPSPEAQLHITLAFMGEVPDEALPSVIAAGEAAARTVTPFTIRLGVAGGFPNDQKPRVWFIHVESPELLKLSAALLPGVQAWADPKPFKGHLTIARPRGPHAPGRPMSFDREWRADCIELVRSRLNSTGAVHECMKVFPFGT
ncbi:MAG TPA: RNA 2',3'-cyclic phosphodiesterase [Candidatus Ozemobacteraceae bacterium]